jgi:F-type H+-transporting ATPase subunit c
MRINTILRVPFNGEEGQLYITLVRRNTTMDKLSLALICIGAALSIGLAGFGAGIGMGNGLRGACDGVARNPEAKGAITTTMILGMALCESIAIYGLVIAFILLYANPFKAALGL